MSQSSFEQALEVSAAQPLEASAAQPLAIGSHMCVMIQQPHHHVHVHVILHVMPLQHQLACHHENCWPLSMHHLQF